MRTTLDLDDELMRAVEKEAAQSGRTMTQIIEQSLRENLLRPQTPREPYRLTLPVVEGRRPPAVDLNDRGALYDFMKRPDWSPSHPRADRGSSSQRVSVNAPATPARRPRPGGGRS